MKKMSDEKFFKSREYLDLETMETTKPELAQKNYDEIDRRSKDKDEIEDELRDGRRGIDGIGTMGKKKIKS